MIQHLLFTLEFGQNDGTIDMRTAVATSSAKTYELSPEHSVEQSIEPPAEHTVTLAPAWAAIWAANRAGWLKYHRSGHCHAWPSVASWLWSLHRNKQFITTPPISNSSSAISEFACFTLCSSHLSIYRHVISNTVKLSNNGQYASSGYNVCERIYRVSQKSGALLKTHIFGCHLQNASTNFYDFWKFWYALTPFHSEHTCWFKIR